MAASHRGAAMKVSWFEKKLDNGEKRASNVIRGTLACPLYGSEKWAGTSGKMIH
jgi:hypothetical protein